MKKTIDNFLHGFKAPYKGVSYLMNNKDLWKWALIPAAIAMICLVGALVFAFGYFPDVLKEWLPKPESFVTSVLYWSGYVLGMILYLALSFIVAYFVATLVAIPFNSFLAERVLIKTGSVVEKPFVLKQWVRVWLSMLMVSVLKSAVFLIVGLVVFVLSWIPLLSIPAAFCGLLILAFDTWDYALEIKEYGFTRRMNAFAEHFSSLAGYASGMGVAFIVPGLGLLLFPGFVVGGALVVAEKTK
jgi:uncharacterized protein involved in cysteine biosynthesis